MQIANIGKHSMAEIGIPTKTSLKIRTKMRDRKDLMNG